MKKNYDVIIVGGGTAGSNLARLLAKNGVSVVVLERDKEKDVAKRLDIIHFPFWAFKEFDLTPSKKGDTEYVKEFFTSYSRSALNNYEKHETNHVVVMHLPKLIDRLKNEAKKYGADFIFNANVEDVIKEDGKIKGVKATIDGTSEPLFGRLIVDATGIESNLRRKLNDPYIETFEIDNMHRFFVLLYYVDFNDPKDEVTHSTGWTWYKSWIAPQSSGKGGIIGCGSSVSLDYCRNAMKKFLKDIPLPSYTINHEETGSTPYTRQPYSLVTDHFFMVGDAAALTNPLSGEGIALNFSLEKLALPILLKGLKDDRLSLEDLWPINYLFQSSEGASDNYLRSSMIGAISTTKEENDFMFKENIIFKSDDDKEPDIPKVLLYGVLHKKFSLKSLNFLLKQAGTGSKLKKLYEDYPKTPKGYSLWVKKADKLWMKAGKVSDLDLINNKDV